MSTKYDNYFICFANFPYSVSRSHIPGTMYFTGFAVIFDRSKTAAFQPYPPNFILGENSFCFLKFLISDFSNLGDNHFPFGGKVLPPNLHDYNKKYNIIFNPKILLHLSYKSLLSLLQLIATALSYCLVHLY